MDSRLINNTLINTSVFITFYKEEKDGKINKSIKVLSGIKQNASYEDIHNAASSVAKLYDHSRYNVKLITTNLIDNEEVQTLETLEEIPVEEIDNATQDSEIL